MKRSKRIEKLLKVMKEDAEKEAIKLADLQKQLSTERKKIGQLEDFRDDYQNNGFSAGTCVRVSQLQAMEKFIQQLDFSISQQTKNIDLIDAHVSAQRDVWLQYHNKVKAYEKWIVRILLEERIIETKQEQKLMDEFVNSRFNLNNKQGE